MSKDFSGGHAPELIQYVLETFKPEDSVLVDIRKRTEAAGIPLIQVGAVDGLHLEVLTRMAKVEKAVEIGTLGGYSGVCIARGLPTHGKLFTFEINEDNAAVARESFKKAGVESKTEIFLGPALENLSKIEKHGLFDLVFIDADKANYPNYLKWAADHLKIGGVVIGDNTFAFGKIARTKHENTEESQSVRALRDFNFQLAQSGRFRATMLPTGEGLTVGVKVK